MTEEVKAILEIGRAVIERLDAQLLWMQQDSVQQTRQMQQLTSSYITQAGRLQSLLDIFGALALPASPQLTREITVNAVSPTLLYTNDTLAFRRIVVTNDDPAQWMYVGKRNVSVNNGEIVMPQLPTAFVIPQSDELWAISVVAPISVRISESYDLLGTIQVIREPDQQ